ncbi:neprilysin-1-like [Paramacrobiotus metropolitanus]|uniref:neprilysin-1-like n=1 Tax=Paramacrobiotus metropolitanus TaxID=2943436 RepID=UPI0024457CB2|nr:neprilysin-1-like [Paramacrobiotus metropolitanus]
MIFLDVVGFLVAAVNVVRPTGRQQLSSPVCTSDLCHQVAHEAVSVMDKTIEPCVDFYAYACNRWNSSHVLARDVLAIKISKQLQGLFDSGNYTNPTEKKQSTYTTSASSRTMNGHSTTAPLYALLTTC